MRYLLLTFLLSFVGIHQSAAQVEGQLVRPDSVFLFGNAVGVSGEVAVIYNSTIFGNSVWVMEDSSGIWNQSDELGALQDDGSQAFGTAVAIDGDVIIAGGPSYNHNGASNGGIAYVYEWSGTDWVGTALFPDDVEGQDEFGLSVGVDGDVIIVGSHKDDDAGTNSGSSYIFRKSGENWIQEANLVPSDTMLAGQLGFSVAVSEDYAIMGGPFELQDTALAGSAYLFEYVDSAWVEAARLAPEQPSSVEGFGWDVTINGDVAMVGANGADGATSISGAVYVYNRIDEVWTLTQKLVASDGGGSAQFGASVDFDGDCAVIGAINDNKVYVFLYDGTMWQEEAIVTPMIGEEPGGFGIDVSISGGNVIVGTSTITIDGVIGGAAFLYNNLCESIATSNESETLLDLTYDLHQNYPNPFSEATTIQFNIEQPAHVRLAVYNVLGQEIAQLKEGFHGNGTHLVTWDASELARGMYIYTMEVDGARVASKRLIVR